MNAFVTGSYAYGTPHEKSDVDLVVHVSGDTLAILNDFVRDRGDDLRQYGADTANLRFGDLNLICIEDAELFRAWQEGTEELIAVKPVTREVAIDVLTKKREMIRGSWEHA